MRYEALTARLFGMSEYVWLRHASPWSVWTRVASLPPLLLAVWSHHWIGWWVLLPVALVVVWLWLNPRLFPPPRSTRGWASRATFGERVWLNRRDVPVPDHHILVAHLLSAAAGAGFAVALVGAAIGWLLPTVAGGAVAWFAKMWFCDRMVWLYDDMKDADPRYAAWLR